MQHVNCDRILGTHALVYVVAHEICSEIALIAIFKEVTMHARMYPLR